MTPRNDPSFIEILTGGSRSMPLRIEINIIPVHVTEVVINL